jgi:putative membrane protein
MKYTTVIALTLSAGAAPVFAQTPPPSPPVEAMTQAVPYLMAAAMSDLYEIKSSELALEKSQNPKIRQFASMVIKDHSLISAATRKAAQKAGLTAPAATMDAGITASITELQTATAADFDRFYVGQQVAAHRAAFSLHSFYSNKGDQRVLKDNARKTLTRIGHHLDMASNLQK